jgi:hypothetical protein
MKLTKKTKHLDIDKVCINTGWFENLTLSRAVKILLNTGQSDIGYITGVLNKGKVFRVESRTKCYYIERSGPNYGKETEAVIQIKRPTYCIEPLSFEDIDKLKKERN